MSIESADDFLKLDPSVQRTEIEKMIAELNRFRRQKYGLQWNENLIADELVVTQCRDKFPVLDAPDDSSELPTQLNVQPAQQNLFDNPDAPQPTHLLIEGDNYHALSALQFTHKNKVDLIYIDPPYNTGNRDFRYNDNFIDKENGDRHSLWLSFMKRRLDLAKDLLKESGVIFISIDDNEVAQLKLLCDAVFGEQNFVANVVWQKNFSIKNDSKYFSQEHEFVLVYFKNIFNGQIKHLERSDKINARYKNIDNDLRGDWVSSDLLRMEHRDNGVYDIIGPSGKVWTPKKGNSWRHPEAEILELIKTNQIWFGSDGNGMPRRKRFLSEVKQSIVPQTIWKHEDVGHTQQAKQELNTVLQGLDATFDTPKPIRLIQQILKLATPNDTPSVILDFFAGSGTTLHAVLEMNRQDGGRRQCILVTNNEVTDKTRRELENKGMTEAEIDAQGICRAVTYPRVRRVIEGYTNAKGDKVVGTGGKLRYYRLAYVERGDRHPDSLKLRIREKCTEMLCIKENVFNLVADSDAVQFNGKGWEIYQDYDGRGTQLVILSEDTPPYVEALLEKVSALKADKRILYVFSYQKQVNDIDFADFKALGFDLQTMPSGIVELYNELYRDIVVKEKVIDNSAADTGTLSLF
jgi:adenine-specific DNA-methyltransferase